MKVIYTAGVFDLLHRGHLHLLQKSAELGDILVVGVVSDAGAAAYKRRPIQDQRTRMEVLDALWMVDHVVLQETTDPTPVLETLRPAVMTHGNDWARLREGHESLARLGVEWRLIPSQGDWFTTSETLELIRSREEEASWSA